MEYVGGKTNKTRGTFVKPTQQRLARDRAMVSILSWGNESTNLQPDACKQGSTRLTAKQIRNITTPGTTPGIIDSRLPDTPENRRPHAEPGNHGTIRPASGKATLSLASKKTTYPKLEGQPLHCDASEMIDLSGKTTGFYGCFTYGLNIRRLRLYTTNICHS